MLAKVRFEYLMGPTSDTTYEMSPSWLHVVSMNGKNYDNESVVVPDPSIRISLYPDSFHEGWAAFLVAQDDTRPLMTFGRNYDGTGGIWFKLF